MKVKDSLKVVILVVVALVCGFFLGSKKVLSVNAKPTSDVADFTEFFKVWDLINSRHFAKDTTTAEEKVWGATKGLVDSLDDPYSVFLTPKENENLNINLSGQFSGVGMEVGIKDSILTVISPLKDSPAEKAGIIPGDKILKIGDTITNDMTIDEAVDLIRGPEGTEVTITILRKDEEETRDFTIKRKVIDLPVLETKDLKDKGVFLITLFEFGEQANARFETALREFQKSGEKKLIIDLRNNPGGFLSSAINISSWFLPAGKVIVSEKIEDGADNKEYKSGGHYMEGNYKVAILVNGGSASASEIVAGALQEHGIAKLVGSQTFGKGSVQELIPLDGGTALKLTIAGWFTPKGKSISKQGLTPDYPVVFDQVLFETKGIDNQLEKAIEILK
jgi:carboxyl-terminal processing protease